MVSCAEPVRSRASQADDARPGMRGQPTRRIQDCKVVASSGRLTPVPARRPAGVSSRLHRIGGRVWVAPDGTRVELPVVLDIIETASDRTVTWSVEATVDLVEGEPRLVAMVFRNSEGIDPHRMRREFRWATPLDVVTRTVPLLMARGVDPYQHDYATRGYPDAAVPDRAPSRRLSDEFLEEIAHRYLALGRGYADELADEYSVSRRTVVSWVETARRRGVLTSTRPGAVGGEVRRNRR